MRALLIAAALGGLTSSDSKDLDRALAGRGAGLPVACLNANADATPQVMSDRVLLYSDGARIWRNDLAAPCPGLDDDALIVNELYGGRVCRGDQFYTLRRPSLNIPGPRCVLGAFVPYDKPR